MIDAISAHRRVPPPQNDPNRSYAPGSPERAELKARLTAMSAETVDIPVMRVPISFMAIVSEKFAQAVLKKAGVESWGMQGFRAALVITGFVVLGLGSNLAWHYPRPVPLGLHRSPSQLLPESAALSDALGQP